MSVTIRAATREDEAAVLGLLAELFAPPAARPAGYTTERGATGFRHAVDDRDADVLLAVEEGRVVGLASVYAELHSMRFGRRCWLEDLVVTAARRSAGVGRALLDAAGAWAGAHDCVYLELESAHARTDAHRFYLDRGMAQPGLMFQRRIDAKPRR